MIRWRRRLKGEVAMSYRPFAWIAALGLTFLSAGSAQAQKDIWYEIYEPSLHQVKKKPVEYLHALAYAPDGRTLVSAGKGGLLFWNVETGKREAGLPIKADEATGVIFSAGGQSLFTADAAGQVLRWDVAKRQVAF